MKPASRVLLVLAALNFLVPLFALYLVTARELDQERHWKSRIQKAQSEAFEIGTRDPEFKKQNVQEIADVFALIVESRRQTADIMSFSMYITWASSAVLCFIAYRMNRNEN